MIVLRSLGEAAEFVRAAQSPASRLMVGIAGAPGAGKSTVAAALVGMLGTSAALLPMDGYHLPQARLVELGRRERMGAPDTFEVPALLTTLRELVENSGQTTLAPGFDRELEEPVVDAIRITPEFSTVIVEGNYLLLDDDDWASVVDYLDLTIYVEVDEDLRHERLIARHERFGKTPDAARAWALGPDEANARIIAATAPRAGAVLRL